VLDVTRRLWAGAIGQAMKHVRAARASVFTRVQRPVATDEDTLFGFETEADSTGAAWHITLNARRTAVDECGLAGMAPAAADR